MKIPNPSTESLRACVRIVLGSVILLLVIAFPQGIVGFLRRWKDRRSDLVQSRVTSHE